MLIPDLQGVENVVLAVGNDVGRQPDERVQPQGDPVDRGRERPADLHDQAYPQAMKLIGRRSTRAAISPGMTSVPPPAAVAPPEVSCDITDLLAAIRYQGVAEKSGRCLFGDCGRQPGLAVDIEIDTT
jgi:hypothetical protein